MPINPPRKESVPGKTAQAIRKLDPLSLILGWFAGSVVFIVAMIALGVR